jgi:hypothetical protein
LMVWGGGVGGSSMMVGWLSIVEMSKSMFSMVACRHARDGHALMEGLGGGRVQVGNRGKGKRASVAFKESRPHKGAVPLPSIRPTASSAPEPSANMNPPYCPPTLCILALLGPLNPWLVHPQPPAFHRWLRLGKPTLRSRSR